MSLLLLSGSEYLGARLRAMLGTAHDLGICRDLAGCVDALRRGQARVLFIADARGAALSAELLCTEDPTGAWRAPPIVLLSPDPADEDGAHEMGIKFLKIPFTRQELLRCIDVVTRARKLVLHCDDSELVHRHVGSILRGAGYDVASARDGAEGLARCLEISPDLVITDVEMPEKDGYALCRAIKETSPHLPVVICSTLSETQSIERGFDAGADDYLVKPAQPEELLSRIELLLAKAQPHRMSRERLLVVDDSITIRRMIAESLRRQGFLVITAVDGADGLAKAKRERPALIISDYDMPRMTGFEMVHALRREESVRDVPVVMLTARDTRRDEAQMRAVGVKSYLVKPFSVDKCVALVERVLAEKRLTDYKLASRMYISDAAIRAAEQAARGGDLFATRADEQAASILFSDISGFTSLSTQRSPREVVELLNSFFDVLCPVIRAEGGDIDKFIGDAIMAVFQEQHGQEDGYALRAVRAGLKMQQALKAWNEAHGHGLHMRVGINTGTVVRGDIGSRFVRRDYTVIGDVVNRAQRFESNAPVGGVLIGESTFQAVKGHVRCEARPGIRLKGVAEPVNAYVVLGLLAESERGGRPA